MYPKKLKYDARRKIDTYADEALRMTTTQMDFLDEQPIEQAHVRLLSTDPELRDHAEMTTAALKLLEFVCRFRKPNSDDELACLRLFIRCYNSCSAASRLIRCGYWHSAGLVIRDAQETCFLLDLFLTDQNHIAGWRSSPAKERERKFSPEEVRRKLDSRDGFKGEKRRMHYKMLSSLTAHPSPEGFVIISPNNQTRIGPFEDADRLRAFTQELVKIAAMIAELAVRFEGAKAPECTGSKTGFNTRFTQWRSKWLQGSAV